MWAQYTLFHEHSFTIPPHELTDYNLLCVFAGACLYHQLLKEGNALPVWKREEKGGADCPPA